MAEYVQIYQDLNDIVAQQDGFSDLGTITADNFADFGKVVSDLNLSGQFMNEMAMKIAKTHIEAREYAGIGPDLMVDAYDWGIITEWVTIEQPAAIIDEAYNITNGQSVDMYEVSMPSVKVNYYAKEEKWVVKVTRYKDQIKSVFKDAETFERFWSAYDVEVENAIREQNDGLASALLATGIAETMFDEYSTSVNTAYLSNTSTKARNLLKEYNDIHTTDPETVATCLENPEFIRFCNKQMNLQKARLKKNTGVFNIAKRKCHTSDEYLKFFVHADYVASARSNLYSTQFNKEDVLMPDGYQELPSFQAIIDTAGGIDAFDFDVTSAVDCTITWDNAGTPTTQNVDVKGILAVMCDKYACVVFNKLRDVETTPINAYGLYTNTFNHMTTNLQFHRDFNFVVFYIAES